MNVTIDNNSPTSLMLTEQILVTGLDQAQALGFDIRQRYVHYSDTQQGAIYRMNDAGLDLVTTTVQQPRVEGLYFNIIYYNSEN